MNPEKSSSAQMVKGVRLPTPEELTVPPRDVFRFFMARVAVQRRTFVLLGVLLLVHAAVVGGSIWLIKTAVDQYFATHATLLLILALALATVGKSLLDFLFNWIQNLAVARVRDALIAETYDDLLHCPFAFHMRERSSRKYGWILEDTTNFVESYFGLFQVWVKQPVQIVSSIAALAAINWKLTVLGLLAVPISVPCIRYLRNKAGEFVAKRKLLLGQLEERIAETIYGIRIVKAFGLEKREFNRVRSIIDQQRHLHQTHALYAGLSGPVAEALALLGLTLVLLLGTQSIFSGSFTAGTFLAFLMAFLNIYRPLKDLSKGFMLQQVGTDAGRRLILLQREARDPLAAGGTATAGQFSAIEYQGVWFAYTGEGEERPWVLKDVNLRISRGETILFTGVSGAGKSTLCDLMFRLFQPQRGTILLNGMPLNSLDRDSHRRLFAMCSQEAIIFNDTLLENVRVARPEASREEVLEVARLAQFTGNMLERLDSAIGDRGTRLSGGERQRLALARALICKPEFLLLDEALNNLDPETEARIWAELRTYLPQCTMLVVSHRWLDLNQYDRLLVLADGCLIEDVKISNDRAASVLEKYREAARSVLTPT